MGIIFSDLPFTELSEYARIDCLICRKSWINNSIGAQIIGYNQEREPPPKAQYITTDYTDFSTTVNPQKRLAGLILSLRV